MGGSSEQGAASREQATGSRMLTFPIHYLLLAARCSLLLLSPGVLPLLRCGETPRPSNCTHAYARTPRSTLTR